MTISKSGRTLYYLGRAFQSLAGQGYKANYFDTESGAHCWISGCRKDGNDVLYPGVIDVDDDVREEFLHSGDGEFANPLDTQRRYFVEGRATIDFLFCRKASRA